MIDSFTGKNFFLSNFYPNNQDSLEHLYQAAKFLDTKYAQMASNQLTPGRAKREARRLKELGYQRSDWESINLNVMKTLLYQKFSNATLREMLLATGDEILIEGNAWGDRFFGCVKNQNGEWVGENHLGRMLMELRIQLKNELPSGDRLLW